MGATKQVEWPAYQKAPTRVYIYFTPFLNSITLRAQDEQVIETFVTSIDMFDPPAKLEFDIAMTLIKSGNAETLYKEHVEKFSNIWNNGRIELDNLELQTNIYSSYYYLYSSLPAMEHYGKLNQFYGLSPGSLSRGDYLSDYQGHSFWDTETWMYPSKF